MATKRKFIELCRIVLGGVTIAAGIGGICMSDFNITTALTNSNFLISIGLVCVGSNFSFSEIDWRD